MQIRLLAPPPHPAILFTITYPDPPEYLGMPGAWVAQLQRLSGEELEIPQTLLALDKTSWLVAVLQSVTFDVSQCGKGGSGDNFLGLGTEARARGTVSCVFTDGKVLEWELGSSAGTSGMGEVKEWEAQACLEMLDSVLRDVVESAMEAEREKMRYQLAQQPPPPLVSEAALAPHNGPKKQAKHKKQRSLLMSLVASLVSPRSSFSQLAPAPQPPLPPAPAPPAPIARFHQPQHTQGFSSLLRRRARSTLVDAFRRHVLCKLSVAFSSNATASCPKQAPSYAVAGPGCYMSWIARSMLERIEVEMEVMIREAGGVPSMYMSSDFDSHSGDPSQSRAAELGWHEGGNLSVDDVNGGSFTLSATLGSDMEPSPTLVDDAPSFMDDAEDNDTAETETDGSSVHTPTDTVTFESSPFAPGLSTSQDCEQSPQFSGPSEYSSSRPTLRLSLPRTPSPPCSPPLSPPIPLSSSARGSPFAFPSSITLSFPQPNFTSSALAAYTALSSQRSRLSALLSRMRSQQQSFAFEERQIQTILEVKGRRRAWSNRQYMGRDRAEMRYVGFSAPTRSSPLARAIPVLAGEVVVLSSVQPEAPNGAEYVEGVNGLEKVRRSVGTDRELVVTTGENNIMRLFPVCEEDEDDSGDTCGFGFCYGSATFAASASREDLSLEASLGEQGAVGLYPQDAGIPSVRLVEDSILRDAEAGLLAPLALQRHPVPIRPRTRSMMQPTPLSTPPLSPTSTKCPPSPSPSYQDSDLTSEDEKAGLNVLEPQTKVDLFDVYSGEDDDSDEGTHGELGFKSEFTLAMDLPPPYRMDVGVQAMTKRYDHWIAGSRVAHTPSR